MSWVDNMLAGHSFLSGEAPGMSDAYVYYLVWFTRERFSGGPSFLQEFQNILDWELRIKKIGPQLSLIQKEWQIPLFPIRPDTW